MHGTEAPCVLQQFQTLLLIGVYVHSSSRFVVATVEVRPYEVVPARRQTPRLLPSASNPDFCVKTPALAPSSNQRARYKPCRQQRRQTWRPRDKQIVESLLHNLCIAEDLLLTNAVH